MREARVLLTPTEGLRKVYGKDGWPLCVPGLPTASVGDGLGYGEAKPKYVSKRVTIGASSSAYGFPFRFGAICFSNASTPHAATSHWAPAGVWGSWLFSLAGRVGAGCPQSKGAGKLEELA